ncbi:MAG: DUF1624 domain-containing protein [Candidatus Hydrogenedentes bacterium]|jgi:predicted acyltransferase|nr:DUF1624 domain-containing protein [Candidatus Hydrogenedentota bacterium]
MTSQTEAPTKAVSARIVSVDVLRGFDMLWLVGGAGVALGIGRLLGSPWKEGIQRQFQHAKWDGFYFYDLIFPLFIFLAGMSIAFSMGRILKEEGRLAALKRLGRRCLIMFLLGIFYNGGLSQPWPEVRILGVLQRIALCCFFAGLLFCFMSWRGMLASLFLILGGYWILLSFIPAPDLSAVSWAEGENWVSWMDTALLPGRILYDSYDPEGILSTLPAVGTCLLGVFAGLLIKSKNIIPKRKAAAFLLSGVGIVLIGYLWGFQCPIIKKIWTPSYVCVSGGYSLILVALFFTVIDIFKVQWWIAPFVWIGKNSLTIYIARSVIDFSKIGDRFVGGSVALCFGEDGAYMLKVSVALGLALLFVWFLDKKRIYLRL